MITEEIEEELPIEKPKKNIKRDKIVTARFTEQEKEIIDETVNKYKTTLTELVRKAVFYYINLLDKNKDLIEMQLLEKEAKKLDYLKNTIMQTENKLDKIKKEISTLDISNDNFKEFIKEWKEKNLK